MLERDAEHSYLVLDHSDEDPMDQLRGHSITERREMENLSNAPYSNGHNDTVTLDIKTPMTNYMNKTINVSPCNPVPIDTNITVVKN